MKRILITRPEPGATETANRLSELGFEPITAPLLSITHQSVNVPGGLAATVLTSRNAIQACPPSVHERPVFAVGAATAALAAEAGCKTIFSADKDAAALAVLIASTLSPSDGTLFLPTAEGQGLELAATLRASNFRVARRVAYKVASVPALPDIAQLFLRRNQVEFAMFFSGETSHHFVRLIRAARLTEALRDVEAVSISDRAAMALRALPWRRVSVAARPNQDEMLAMLK